MDKILVRHVPDILIYHAKCSDGIAACWAIWATHPNRDALRLVPATHGDALPADIGGRNIMLVDFCYDVDLLSELCDRAASVCVIDHHESTKRIQLAHPRLSGMIDTKMCGAQLAYQYAFPKTVFPWQITMIADHDLGRFRWPWTAVRAAAASYGYFDSVPMFDQLMQFHTHASFIDEGRVILTQEAASLKEALHRIRYAILKTDDGKELNVILASPPFKIRSAVARTLLNESFARKADLVVLYRYIAQNDEWRLSLRSLSLDVSAIASMFAVGGGSAVAAGATLYGSRSSLGVNAPCRSGTYGRGLWDYFALLPAGQDFAPKPILEKRVL